MTYFGAYLGEYIAPVACFIGYIVVRVYAAYAYVEWCYVNDVWGYHILALCLVWPGFVSLLLCDNPLGWTRGFESIHMSVYVESSDDFRILYVLLSYM